MSNLGGESKAEHFMWPVFFVLAFLAQALLSPNACCLANPRSFCRRNWAAQDEALHQGLAALKDNHLEVALDRLTAAEQLSPSDARIRNFRGIVLAQLGRNPEARSEYRDAIRLDPKLEDAYKNLGFLEWTEHNLDAARLHLERALDLAPADPFAHYYLGRVQLDTKFYESAFRELDRSNVPWPADADFLVQAATGYRALGRIEEVRKTLDRLSNLPLSNVQVVSVAARLVSTGESQTAIEILRKVSVRKEQASSGWARFDLALAYLLTASYEKAIDEARAFLTVRPMSVESASARSLIGIADARLNRGEAAVEALRDACRLDPTREEHWLNLTRELMELNQYAGAISAVQEGLGANPTSYALHLRLGAAYLSIDRYSDAESVFRRLIAAGDPLPTSYVGLAQVLLRTGRAEDAVSELTAASGKLGPNFLIRYFRGLALDRAGRPGEAVPEFEDAIRLNPNSAEAHLALGKTQLAIGSANDAKAELEHSLRLDPNNVEAQRLLIQALRRSGDAQAVSKNAEPVSELEPGEEGGDLLGDFLAPDWLMPQGGTGVRKDPRNP